MSKEGKIAAGRILGAHGIGGEITVSPQLLKEDLLKFITLLESRCETVYIDSVAYTLEGVRGHKNYLLVKLKEISDRSVAAALRGKELFIDEHILPPSKEGEYYYHELIGVVVEGDGGEAFGKVYNIYSAGSCDIIEVKGRFGDVAIPLTDDAVIKVDIKEKRIVVRMAIIESLLKK